MRLIRVPTGRLPEFWPHVRNGISESVRRSGAGSFRFVEQSVLHGEMDLWLALDGEVRACAVTCVLDTEWDRFCSIKGCYGHGSKTWLHLLRGIEDWAREQGCKRMWVGGRRGWKKLLKDYRETRVMLEKAL